MKSRFTTVDDHGTVYPVLMFVCPGCEQDRHSGLHMLPVNTTLKSPSWDWDGNLESPTISPSILTRVGNNVCHSFLRNGVFEFLSDCTHKFAGQQIPIPDLYDWVVKDYYKPVEGDHTN